jgi:hypothetical protein
VNRVASAHPFTANSSASTFFKPNGAKAEEKESNPNLFQ